MANIIDETYFINENSIPVTGIDKFDVAIKDSIVLYEEKVLDLLLGYKLRKEMKAAYDASVLTESPVTLPEKWNRFINGAEFEYTVNGEVVLDKWIGLKNASKRSLIANYVYFFHRKNNVSQNSGAGETISNTENSTVTSPYVKCFDAWNEMVDLYGELDECGNPIPKPSAYNFLLTNASDYPDWRFTPIKKNRSVTRIFMQ